MRTATRLAPITLSTFDAQPCELGSLWRDRTVVLVFLRHFG